MRRRGRALPSSKNARSAGNGVPVVKTASRGPPTRPPERRPPARMLRPRRVPHAPLGCRGRCGRRRRCPGPPAIVAATESTAAASSSVCVCEHRARHQRGRRRQRDVGRKRGQRARRGYGPRHRNQLGRCPRTRRPACRHSSPRRCQGHRLYRPRVRPRLRGLPWPRAAPQVPQQRRSRSRPPRRHALGTCGWGAPTGEGMLGQGGIPDWAGARVRAGSAPASSATTELAGGWRSGRGGLVELWWPACALGRRAARAGGAGAPSTRRSLRHVAASRAASRGALASRRALTRRPRLRPQPLAARRFRAYAAGSTGRFANLQAASAESTGQGRE